MRQFLFPVLFLSIIISSCSQQTSKEAEQLTFLHAQGMKIVDEKGAAIQLKGVGLGNWMLPEGYMWRFGKRADRPRRIEKLISDLIGKADADSFWQNYRHNYITEKDIEQISALGFNSVRPALNARLFLSEEENPQFVQEGFDLVDSLVTWCTRHKLYVILDMHGAPGGQTGQNIDDSEFDEPRLFMENKYEPRLTQLWLKIAEKYSNNPTIAGYDLLNEPLPKVTGAAEKYKHLLEPMYQRLTQAIRTVDKKHMIILEGVDWSNDWSVFTKPFDDNLVYQFHYYCWEPFENVNSIQPYLDKRAEWNVPIWVGETGEKSAAMHWATIQLLNDNNIGWSFWPWKKLVTQKTGNNPYSIEKPEGWDSLAIYSSRNKVSIQNWVKPIFESYLENIRLENCTENSEMINTMMQRIPARVEAENFGGKGLGVSYFVSDTTKSANYRRTESVKVSYINAYGGKMSDGQYITLGANEWTVYNFGAVQSMNRNSSIKIRAIEENSTIEIWANADRIGKMDLNNKEWKSIPLDAMEFYDLDNTLKINVVSGKVDIDYIDIH